MERHRAGRDAVGYVLFARFAPPPWVRAVWYHELAVFKADERKEQGGD